MKVTVFASETSAQVGQKLKCGPTWSTFFIPGTSDQLGPKLEIRAKLARIIWPGRRHELSGRVEGKNVRQVGAHFREAHRNKVAPSWREVQISSRELTSCQFGAKLLKGGEAKG